MRAENYVSQQFSFIDPFGRAREIRLLEQSDGLFVHASGRLYRREGDELRLVGSYNEPVFDKANPQRGCQWRRISKPLMFEGVGAALGRIV